MDLLMNVSVISLILKVNYAKNWSDKLGRSCTDKNQLRILWMFGISKYEAGKFLNQNVTL